MRLLKTTAILPAKPAPSGSEPFRFQSTSVPALVCSHHPPRGGDGFSIGGAFSDGTGGHRSWCGRRPRVEWPLVHSDVEDIRDAPLNTMKSWLIEAIDGATKEVLLAVQKVGLPRIAQALITAQQRGIRVEVLMESN